MVRASFLAWYLVVGFALAGCSTPPTVPQTSPDDVLAVYRRISTLDERAVDVVELLHRQSEELFLREVAWEQHHTVVEAEDDPTGCYDYGLALEALAKTVARHIDEDTIEVADLQHPRRAVPTLTLTRLQARIEANVETIELLEQHMAAITVCHRFPYNVPDEKDGR